MPLLFSTSQTQPAFKVHQDSPRLVPPATNPIVAPSCSQPDQAEGTAASNTHRWRCCLKHELRTCGRQAGRQAGRKTPQSTFQASNFDIEASIFITQTSRFKYQASTFELKFNFQTSASKFKTSGSKFHVPSVWFRVETLPSTYCLRKNGKPKQSRPRTFHRQEHNPGQAKTVNHD